MKFRQQRLQPVLVHLILDPVRGKRVPALWSRRLVMVHRPRAGIMGAYGPAVRHVTVCGAGRLLK
ncbi:MAG: hypothetical protein AMXMBFR45_25730 [Gammaproteobacteria bacterium]|nr:MAG: hypothetical protein BroJett010_26990 [Gammaproteobacteria bacterium]